MIWATVPHVTIAPIARGVGRKLVAGSRYFPYYTRPWIDDDAFDPREDPHITGPQARAIDYAIDAYNDVIQATVEQARDAGRDWYLLEIAGVLDRLAHRRFIEDPNGAPGVVDAVPAAAGAAGAATRARLALPDRRRQGRTGRAAGCSRSTACTRRRSATGSSPRRSSTSCAWPASSSPAPAASTSSA